MEVTVKFTVKALGSTLLEHSLAKNVSIHKNRLIGYNKNTPMDYYRKQLENRVA